MPKEDEVRDLPAALEEHYGVEVWTNLLTDPLRKKQCLCLFCTRMKTCTVAETLYGVCKVSDVALMVTRCPDWDEVPLSPSEQAEADE